MSNLKDVKYNWFSIPKLYMLTSNLPEETINNINKYLDELVLAKNKKDHSKTLVGQIKNGEQLTIDINHPLMEGYKEITISLCKEYMKIFKEKSGNNNIFTENTKLDFDEVWSVHSFDGDYNPRHDHITKSKTGLSTTLWTKVPQQIIDNPDMTDTNFSPNESSGHLDGCIDFQPFDHGSRVSHDLHLGGTLTVKPTVSKMFIFPSWLLHSVYPFRGPGERRTIASNINIWN